MSRTPVADPVAQALAQTRQVIVWSALLLGWMVIIGLYAIGILGNSSPNPPFPSGGAAAAAAGFWFVFVLFLNGAADLVELILGYLDRGPLSSFVRGGAFPIVAVGVGLLFARLLWS